MPTPTFTSRLVLTKPDGNPTTGDFVDIATLNSNADKIDASVGAIACTSAARPASPFNGQLARETDTKGLILWNGAAWEYVVKAFSCTSITRPATPYADMIIFETDTQRLAVRSGGAWVYADGAGSRAVTRDMAATNSFTNQVTYGFLNQAADRAALTISFVKVKASSRLVLSVAATMQLTSGLAQKMWIGLRVGGSDRDVAQAYPSQATSPTTHTSVVGFAEYTGLAAGTYTIEPIVRCGSSVIVLEAAKNFISYSVVESP